MSSKKSNKKTKVSKVETFVENPKNEKQNNEYFDWRNLPDHYDPSLDDGNGIPLDRR